MLENLCTFTPNFRFDKSMRKIHLALLDKNLRYTCMSYIQLNNAENAIGQYENMKIMKFIRGNVPNAIINQVGFDATEGGTHTQTPTQ